MQITSVTYSRLKSFGNYENARVEATAIVGEDENEDAAASNLIDYVERQLRTIHDGRDALQSLQSNLSSLEYRKENVEREVETLRSRCDRMVQFLKMHGVEVTSNELPF